jgi:hypothetical protein
MPRNVRNFWVELDVDGKESPIASGPRNKNGGISMSIKMRDEGCVAHAVDIEGHAKQDGSLSLQIVPNRELPYEYDADYGLTIRTKR